MNHLVILRLIPLSGLQSVPPPVESRIAPDWRLIIRFHVDRLAFMLLPGAFIGPAI